MFQPTLPRLRKVYGAPLFAIQLFDSAYAATTEAMEGEADFIVSRDPHLRNLKEFQGIEIVDVKMFVERVKKGK